MNRDNCPKTTYRELSFRFLLETILLFAVQEMAIEIGKTIDISMVSVRFKAIPLRKIQDDILITYQTAIALKLSHQWNKPVAQVAERIVFHICNLSKRSLAQDLPRLQDGAFPPITMAVCHALTVSIQANRYIQFHLSSTTLDTWLQALQLKSGHDEQASLAEVSEGYLMVRQRQAEARQVSQGYSFSEVPFTVIYAHARCCSILRLAHTTGQITLHPLLAKPGQPLVLCPPWTLLQPQPIPWSEMFSLPEQISEREIAAKIGLDNAFPLLFQIITSLDQYADLPLGSSYPQKMRHKKLLEMLLGLSNAFHRFDADFALCGAGSMGAGSMGAGFTKGHRHSGRLRLISSHLSSGDPGVKHACSLGLILIVQRLLHDFLVDLFPQDPTQMCIPYEL